MTEETIPKKDQAEAILRAAIYNIEALGFNVYFYGTYCLNEDLDRVSFEEIKND